MANEIVKKHIVDDLYNYSISYDEGPDFGVVAGMHLTGGIPVVHEGIKYVRFETKFKGQTIQAKYESRPELAALVAEYEAIEAQITADRTTKQAVRQAKQDAIDKPLIEAMKANEAPLRASIPADHVEVIIKQTGDLDGDPMLTYRADGIKLGWQDVNIIGVASAVRPGAMGAFVSVYIASISRERLEEIRAAQQVNSAASQTAKEARQKELKETIIPESALSAYRHYHGDADKAWEDENETSWALIRHWTPYIEMQHGMDSVKLQREATEMSREVNYGINEG